MDEDEELGRFKHDLHQFRNSDEKLAQDAFERLASPSRRYVYALLRREISLDDRDEIVQTVLVKAWQHRSNFTNQGRAAWFAWLKRITHNAYVDLMRAKRPDVALDYVAEREDEELPLIERCMTSALGKEFFYLADVDLLGLEGALTPEEQDRRLLAAQYYYMDQWSVEELLDHLAETRPESPPISRAQLDSWLEAHGTLRYLAYRELYFSPERLTASLLGLSEASTAGDLDRVLTNLRETPVHQEGLNRWTSLEAQAILWRYFRGLTVTEVESLLTDDKITGKLISIFARCSADFPFFTQMKKICAWIEMLDALGIELQALLGCRSGLWYRLAFEYRYRHSLPHRDVQERLSPAAQVVQCEITLDMLNTWLSGGRLLNRLRQYYEKRHGGQDHG